MTSPQLYTTLTEHIKRDGFTELEVYLKTIGYFTAPASGGNHMSEEGGLLQHSVNVTTTLFDVAKKLGSTIPSESLAIVGLFHDLGKADYYGKPTYEPNILKSGKLSDAKPYKTNKELLGVPHEVASVQMLTKFISLTEDEVHAIYFHNGLYTPSGYALKGKETELQILLHFADMWASRIIEMGGEGDD